jgi:dihydroneopterin aldolase
VVVPGGGPFADAVRLAQPTMGFDDSAAHDMALMAMAQFGRALAGLAGWVYADTMTSLLAAIDAGRIPVWSPWPMLSGHPYIAQNWGVTSDSLAVWLAMQLQATRVVLIKHCPPPADTSPDQWASLGLVDTAFSGFVSRFAGQVRMIGPDDVTSGLAG